MRKRRERELFHVSSRSSPRRPLSRLYDPRVMPMSSPTTSPQSTRIPHRYESLEDLLQSPTCPSPSPHSNTRASNLFRTSLHSRHTSNADSIETQRGNDRDLTRVEPRSTLDDDLDTRTTRFLTTFDMINLTLGLAGAQLTWTVEMAQVPLPSLSLVPSQG